MSLDGFIEDEAGAFDWGNPDPLHPFFVELLAPVGTYLYGRRLYETMAYWDGPVERYPPAHRDFARIWQKPEKIVFSRTLTTATTRNTRIERNFDIDAIQKLKRESERDLAIGGAELAGVALEAGLVDACHLFVHPIVAGGGKHAFRPGLRQRLELRETRRFDTGVMYAHYRVGDPGRIP